MNRVNQQGLSSLQLLILLAVVGFFLLTAFKLGPLYIDNYFVKSAIESMHNEDLDNLSESQIRRKLGDYFTVNNVRDIDTKDVKLERDAKGTRIILNYEKRVDFLSNVDVVVTFNNTIDSAVP